MENYEQISNFKFSEYRKAESLVLFPELIDAVNYLTEFEFLLGLKFSFLTILECGFLEVEILAALQIHDHDIKKAEEFLFIEKILMNENKYSDSDIRGAIILSGFLKLSVFIVLENNIDQARKYLEECCEPFIIVFQFRNILISRMTTMSLWKIMDLLNIIKE